jgi:hypothetical protein
LQKEKSLKLHLCINNVTEISKVELNLKKVMFLVGILPEEYSLLKGSISDIGIAIVIGPKLQKFIRFVIEIS